MPVTKERERCHCKMAQNRRCGRLRLHPGFHQSEESLALKASEASAKARERRARLGPPPSRIARLANRGQALELPAGLLPGSALASLAKYSLSGLVQPGDTMYRKIAERLAGRELARVS